ncbi:hypothetical protein E2562_027351 [Oryza meyeriana var. granulata]|uniref:Secreted protein n=1 Tax=Oryza meyeriana var. granulata TaxID=110450 RepID=A0A6G1E340_9ORYZ|nr:hypothetical protein E2562_027351 [Oryza meyeriana var. granulata]
MAGMAWGILSSSHWGGASLVLTACVSPAVVILGADHQQQMYCHLLCSLWCRDAADCIHAPYAAGLAHALRLL